MSAAVEVREVVELMDPDWRDHFSEISQAAEFYQRYATAQWAAAYAEIADTEEK